MKLKAYFTTFLLILTATFLLVGCKSSSLEGTYIDPEHDEKKVIFSADGTCTLYDSSNEYYNATYVLEGDSITITFDSLDFTFQGNLDGSEIHLESSEGNTLELIKSE